MSQIAYGDILLLNKTDLVSPERIKAVEAGIRTYREDVKNSPRSAWPGTPAADH